MLDPDFFDLNDCDSNTCTLDSHSICDDCKDGCLTLCRYEPLPNEPDFFRLIDDMVHEINLLEAEVVRTRQVLACYLPDPWNEGLYDDILRGLSKRFTGDYEPYDRYINYYYNGIDPMDDKDKTDLMLRLMDGVDETTYYHLLP